MATEASTAYTLFDIRIDGTIAEISSSQTIRKRTAESALIRFWQLEQRMYSDGLHWSELPAGAEYYSESVFEIPTCRLPGCSSLAFPLEHMRWMPRKLRLETTWIGYPA